MHGPAMIAYSKPAGGGEVIPKTSPPPLSFDNIDHSNKYRYRGRIQVPALPGLILPSAPLYPIFLTPPKITPRFIYIPTQKLAPPPSITVQFSPIQSNPFQFSYLHTDLGTPSSHEFRHTVHAHHTIPTVYIHDSLPPGRSLLLCLHETRRLDNPTKRRGRGDANAVQSQLDALRAQNCARELID